MTKVEKYYPRDALKQYVKMFIVIEAEDGLNSLVLPDTSFTIAFTLMGKVKYLDCTSQNDLPPIVISGINRSASQFNYTKQTSNILILFRETGISAFVKEPLNLLSDKKISMDNFFSPSTLAAIQECLLEAGTNQKRILILEQFLVNNLLQSKRDPVVENAIGKIKSCKGNIKISELLELFPISRDPFEKRFRRVTGTSPKQFATIVRLRSLVSEYTSMQTLTSLAYTAGYFDQAHFIKDFKSFTGLTPSGYFTRFGRS